MKCSGILFVIALVVTANARPEHAKHDLSKKELHYNVERALPISKRIYLSEKEKFRCSKVILPGAAMEQESSGDDKVLEPLRISVFNDGDYTARLRVNYIQGNLQQDNVQTRVFDSLIPSGSQRSLFVPTVDTNHLWIRIHIEGANVEENLINCQMLKVPVDGDRCFLLAGSGGRPLYGLCPYGFEDMLDRWDA